MCVGSIQNWAAPTRTLVGLGVSRMSRPTRRRVFLEEMDRVVPWTELVALITPYFPEVRLRLDALDTDELVARLGRLDPAALRRIDPSNRRRLLRALEVCESTGQPFSSFGPGLDVYASTPHRLVGLRVDRGALATRIRMRVTAMLDAGWLDEVAGLTERGPWSRTAAQAIGYRELAEHLAGRSSLAEAVDATVQRTRRFAVRQMRWFARDPRIQQHLRHLRRLS